MWFPSSWVKGINGKKIKVAFPSLKTKEHYGCVYDAEAFAFFCNKEERDSLKKSLPYTLRKTPSFVLDPILLLPSDKISSDLLKWLSLSNEDAEAIATIGNRSFVPLWPLDEQRAETISRTFKSLSKEEKSDFFFSYFAGYECLFKKGQERKRYIKNLIIEDGLKGLVEKMSRFPPLFSKGAEGTEAEDMVDLLSQVIRNGEKSDTYALAKEFFLSLEHSSWSVIATFFFLSFGESLRSDIVLSPKIPYPKKVREIGDDAYGFHRQIRKRPAKVINSLKQIE